MTNSQNESAHPLAVPENARVLLVEDERDMSRLIEERLAREGLTITTATNSADALQKLHEIAPSIIIMDVRLGREDGITLAGTMRHTTDAPILFVSGASTPEIRSRAFECGTSDFIPKPFSLGEFSARFRALLRLAARATTPTRPAVSRPATIHYEFDGWTYIPAMRQLISPDGFAHGLRQAHFDLLNAFMKAPHHLIPFDGLCDNARKPNAPDLLRANIKSLRRLLGDDSSDNGVIRTTRKVGYQLTATVTIRDPQTAAAD